MDTRISRGEWIFTILVGIFVGSLIISTVLARKPIIAGGILVNFGVFIYATTFVLTDIVVEIWGKAKARSMVIAGFGALLVSYAWTILGVAWPGAPMWKDQEAFNLVLSSTARFMTGGIVAYLAAQFYDVWAFLLLKRRTNGRYLWLRTNVATIPAQFIDTFIFITIGFYGVLPLAPLIWGVLTIKVAVALVTQFGVYAGVWILRRQPDVDMFATEE